MRLALLIMGLVLSSASFAQGKALHDAVCLECHASLGGGNPHQLYQRDDRNVKNLAALEKRVAYCMIAADVSWDKAQQQAVVTYLREQFYPF
jgi:mono/diheme cytochrome c family protein